MKKKLYVTRTIKLLSFGLLLVLVLLFLQKYPLSNFDDNDNRLRMDGYYLEDKDSLDVVLLGSSEMYSGVIPAKLYEDYGITSYPYATSSSTAGAMATQTKEIKRTQNPQLIVIEINAFLYGTANETKESSLRGYIDNVPMNVNKFDYIRTVIEPDDRAEYFFPIVKYHGVWNDYPKPLNRCLTMMHQEMRGYTYLRGFKTNANIFKLTDKSLSANLPGDNKTLALDKRYEPKLKEFLQYLKDEKIENVLFMRMPHLVTKQTYNRFKRGNEAGRMIQEAGFDFINLERDEEMMSLPADYYYNLDHLNINGAEKLTSKVGNNLTEKYHVEKAKLTDKQAAEWQESVDFYHDYYAYVNNLMKTTTKPKGMRETDDIIRQVRDYAAKHQ